MSFIIKHDRSPVADLKSRWQSRNRTDRQVTGSIELAYMRGYQGGYEDAEAKKSPKHFVNCKSTAVKKHKPTTAKAGGGDG